jgi:uncharacterized protein YdiU (UPF0061 family)
VKTDTVLAWARHQGQEAFDELARPEDDGLGSIGERADADVLPLFEDPGAFRTSAETWRRRLGSDPLSPAARASSMKRVNPAFIPRNHRVEEAIEAAVRRGDLAPFDALAGVLSRPYEDQLERANLAAPPGPEWRTYRTFCGT